MYISSKQGRLSNMHLMLVHLPAAAPGASWQAAMVVSPNVMQQAQVL
jgi:hypothetical protein